MLKSIIGTNMWKNAFNLILEQERKLRNYERDGIRPIGFEDQSEVC
jgi:hypothetical protein